MVFDDFSNSSPIALDRCTSTLGLRSLFFALSGAIQHLRYLNYGLSLVLCFIGVKMVCAEGPTLANAICGWLGRDVPAWVPAEDSLHLPTWVSLIVICSVLAVTVVVSLVFKPHEESEKSLRSSSSSDAHDLPLGSSSSGAAQADPAPEGDREAPAEPQT